MGIEVKESGEKRCLILCAGALAEKTWERLRQLSFSVCIAADGGWKHARDCRLKPDLILGDFDSSPRPTWDGVEIQIFPPEKDDTDTMLAVKEGLRRGCREFWIVGGMGGRFDHTFANLQTLEYLTGQGAQGFLLDEHHLLTVFRNGTRQIPKPEKGYLSVFSLAEESIGVTLRGTEYPLENATLRRDFPLGVSNHITAKQAEISVREGTLLVVLAEEA